MAPAQSVMVSDPIFRPSALRALSIRPAYLESSAWFEHIPFAFWLIESHRPRQFVELGTHRGTSYFAFCQAVERLGMNTRCFAIDTWKGDEHAGFYGAEIFQQVKRYNSSQYSGFSRLVRSTFDEAVEHFSDGSIDLLHIDGLHTLEAVRHDFETWLPKLSENGVVVMHDTNVREHGFGVFGLFEELREIYPYFEFVHGHGLGVLGVGEQQNEHLLRLFEAQHDKSARRMLHEIFSRLGRACADAFVAQQQQARQLEFESAEAKHTKEIENLEKARKDMEERLRGSEQENRRRITELETERDGIKLENGRLAKNIQTRFDELAKLTKMLLEAGETTSTLEARMTSVVSEIARLDRMTEAMPSSEPVTVTRQAKPAVRNIEIGSLSKRPIAMEFGVEGEQEPIVEVTLFGEFESRVTAARLTAEALDSDGNALAGARWKRYAGYKAPVSRVRAIARTLLLRLQRREHYSHELSASPEGEGFSGRVALPEGTSRLRLRFERLIKGPKLLLVRGSTMLFDQPVVPNSDLTLKIEVQAERSLQRAAMLVPQYFDAAGAPLPFPYAGFRSDEIHPAFAYLSAAPKARPTFLQLKVPATAARLRLQMRPALARGHLNIVQAEPLNPVFSFTREPRNGTVKVSLTLLSPFADRQAAVLLATYYDDGGKRIQAPFQRSDAPGQSPSFHYLAAGPCGATTTFTLAAPEGTRRCKIEVMSGRLDVGLRVEVGSAAKEAAHIDGALLPAEGVELECEIESNAILSFKLRATAARDLSAAGICAVTYVNSAGETILPPYAGLQEDGESGGVLSFGASSNPQGRVEVVRLPCPPGAARASLRFLPNTVEDALRIRIEPLGNRRSIVKLAN